MDKKFLNSWQKMSHKNKNKFRKPGLSPGELSGFEHSDKNEFADIYLIKYNELGFEEGVVSSVDEMIVPSQDSEEVYWYNIDGVNNPDQLSQIEQKYNLHPLLMEDIASAEQRPKLDDYDDCLFLTVKMIRYDEKINGMFSEQVSFVVAPNLILSFQEKHKEGDVFNPNRERLRANKGKMRKMNVDYLLYSLLDTIVDHYFEIMEYVGDKLETIEQQMLTDPDPAKLKELYKFRRELIYLRKSVWPLREVIVKLERNECSMISEAVKPFLRDVYDHTIQVIETVESTRDILSGIVDVYLSSVSNRMNSVMKVLTVISTIFMPLAFITGLYGMNFDNMPELHAQNGYYVVIGICVLVALTMLFYFQRKKWL
ncbi:magnesium/cobalt transporter CorA [Cytophaga aurantiaca]|uniref:magnesium/cobalt transporter CorA n=1 Tax=Cytophaga aurantiaca TaxID=29530 RepID=UPI00036CB4FB|nr:magnesium/cobalt transporter CorA [Cytophaga aurantiaca]